jgi:diadenosine tetraphosphate (Ap4A) HIT family hydrolase
MHRAAKEEALALLAEHRRAIGAADDACLMCLLAEKRGVPAPVYEDDHALVILDRFASREGHLLVIARDHIEGLTELGWEKYSHLQRVAFDAARAIEGVLTPRRFFLAALGAPQAVPMSFPHFHLHVIPLFEADDSTRPARVFSWTDGVVVYEDHEAEELANKLRRAWPRDVADTRPGHTELNLPVAFS